MRNGEPLLGTSPLQNKEKVGGFAYVLLLIGVAVISIGATASLSLGAKISRREAELALFAVGTEYQQALRSYAGVPANSIDAVNTIQARGPRSLDELLKDPRSPSTRRHLRQIYADPLTGREQWGLVKNPAGLIVGVYSLAEGKPIKQTGFSATQASFEEAASYSGWVFGLPSAQLPINVRASTADQPTDAH